MLEKGLSEKRALELKKKFGENVIPSKDRIAWISILFSQFKSPLIYILIIVSFVSLFFKEYTDVILVWSVIVLNTIMGFSQEYQVEKTLAALKKILKPKTIVIRDGQRKEIEAKELVPGDLVVLGGGDRVPADGKIIEGFNLLISEAILTGEEDAVVKTTEEENNNVSMGTIVIAGRGVMTVLKTGRMTEIGKIEKNLSEIKERKTPIQLKLDEFSKSLGGIIVVVCLVVFLVGVLYQADVLETFKFAIILSVAAIPEGLPIAITIILALGMRRILKKKGLVKKLTSIETLGAASIICTDKTGTLTEGKMKVVKVEFTDKEKAFFALTLNNEQRSGLEVAIWEYVKEQKIIDPQKIFDKTKRTYEEQFDSEKKYSITINEVDNKSVAFLKGAPEIILSFCHLSAKEKDDILRKIEKWADSGLRLLGIAFKNKGDLKEKTGFTWLGLVGIVDPIRKDAKEAILNAQAAGIKIKIVTGDYRKTAERVAADLGFKIKPENVLEGKDLETISERELKKIIDNIIIFSRVAPHQKQKIIKGLQEKGEVVAMTGDGANDVLALKKADIGVVVGSASEVAKESGDLILLDNNFKTIVAAIEEGRLIFSNIKKVVSFVLSNSFIEIFLIFGSIILKLPYPLTIVQILWLHIICDGPSDIVLGFEPKEKDLMKERPENLQKESILSNSMKILIFGISFIVGLLCLFFFYYFLNKTGDIAFARTLIFAIVAVVDLVYIFSFKDLKKPIFKTDNFFHNKFMIFSVIFGLALTFIAIYIPAMNKILGTQPLQPIYWLLIFGISLVTTLWVELVKFIFSKRHKINNNQ
jgi:Ca2+-transporting ATPase